MLKEFFSSLKKEEPEAIRDIAKEKIIILPNLPEEIKDLLEEAYLLEHKQLKTKDARLRRELCGDALIKYQKALDKVSQGVKIANRRQMHDMADIYNAESIYIRERMDYLLTARKYLKEKKQEEAA
ncbi:hypothetical protein JW977_04275 [Candidatus Falkowbacteria bacterium]|nr:hypothetical protein [Candidatus Falkowbacteria bacterium]